MIARKAKWMRSPITRLPRRVACSISAHGFVKTTNPCSESESLSACDSNAC